MSASVRRRIERNIRERETGHRSPKGHGRVRHLNPFQRLIKEKALADVKSKAKAMSIERQRMTDEHGKGVR